MLVEVNHNNTIIYSELTLLEIHPANAHIVGVLLAIMTRVMDIMRTCCMAL